MRGTRLTRILIATVLTTALMPVSAVQVMGAGSTFTELPICTDTANQVYPVASGEIMVWQDDRNGNWDIYAYNLSTGVEFPICTNSANQEDPSISGDVIVWEDVRDGDDEIYMYDLVTNQEVRITDYASNQSNPTISGDTIVWQDYRNGNPDIYGYDLTTGVEFPICTNSADQDDPEISGDLVVWGDSTHEPTAYNLSTGTTVTIDPTNNANDPSVWGDMIAWEHDDDDIYGYSYSAGTSTPLHTGGDAYIPFISSDLVVWEDSRNATYDVYGYNRTTMQEIPICTAAMHQYNPQVTAGVAVWQDGRSGTNWDIYIADFDLAAQRVGGNNRYDTAARISRTHETFKSEVAILATGGDFPDALSAAGLAGVYHAPLLLIGKDAVPTEVKNELARAGTQKVILIGGTGVISSDVADDLDSDGYTVQRIAGADRYETSAKIAEEIVTLMGPRFEGKAIIARGDSFPDALSMSPIAYNRKSPILLTNPTSLPSKTAQAITALNIENAIIAGGTGAVSGDVETAINALMALHPGGDTPALRWAGNDRYETSAKIATEAKKYNLVGSAFVGLATGQNFPDALAGGVACGEEYGVVLLTPPTGLPDSAQTFLANNKGGISAMEAFGGTTVLPDSVMDAAEAAASN